MPGMSCQQSSKKRPPALGLALACDAIAGDPPSFSMATPRGGATDVSKHFIGTPTAVGILNAFLDFDDTVLDNEGPPLDFDDAMAALELRGNADIGEVCCTSAQVDECDSSGSTRCSATDASEGFGVESRSSCASDEEDNESEYEDDFESESESECSEGECAGLNREAAFAANSNPSSASRSSSRSRRTRSSSRAKRSSSRPVVQEPRSRCRSLPRCPRI